ncbi:hypothetical protein K1T71_007828 [Dendrolimus kikuchii]|uniref:Uncharacterized protein n=1 Tax=Dendrolimus kikuchii TaxID=765133 RepID=A0ACC1CYV7_9NEOP|nr:hypothetical protein K1T71_007828 [Dendrolimus kikuchii]
MVVNDDNSVIKYKFQRKAGRNIIEHRPVFTPDGESLAVIVENIIRVYNLETGDCVRTLETESAVDDLIAIQFPENEDYNLYGCSSKGYVTIWTWEKGAVLREIKLNIPSDSKILTFNLIDSTECFITAGCKSNKFLYIARFSMKTGQLLSLYKINALYYNMVRVVIGWCEGERFAAITNGTKTLYIQNINKPHVYQFIMNSNDLRILAVAAHHKASAVAITDTLGRTTVIRGNLFDKTSIAREVLHWHYLPPLDVCFSLQGSYLYSGGIEKVLVKWTLSNLAHEANSKEFIPRLPGFVRYITNSNTHIAISLSNNSVVIANARMRVLTTILECGGLSPVARTFGSMLLYHQPSRSLIMPGRVGHLQLYSTVTDKVLYNVDITGLNPIPAERWNILPIETEVSCAGLCGNGTWLVTSEYRNDGVIYPEEKLKFWQSQKGPVPFELNTVVNLSHGGCNVVSIVLNFFGDLCVTAGSDQKFRVWKRETSSDNPKKKIWTCLTTCYYSSGVSQFSSHGVYNDFKIGKLYKRSKENDIQPYLTEVHKDDVIYKIINIHKEQNIGDPEIFKYGMRVDEENDMGGVAISADGSLIAAWFGCKLTLWDTHLCNLRTTLSHPALRPKGIDVKFGSKDAAHYLVCTTATSLAVWSLLSLTVKWMVQIQTSCLAADRFSNRMAVTTNNNDVFVFSPQSPSPILVRKNLLDPETGVFKQCCFGNSTANDIRVYLMRNNSEIYCVEPEQTKEGRLEVISKRNMPKSKFGALLAEKQLSEVRPARPGEEFVYDLNAVGGAAVAQFASASPHMLPPVSILCTTFLKQLTGQQQPEENEDQKEDNIMEIDQPSSDDEGGDSEKLNGPYTPKVAELWTPNYEAVKTKKLNKVMKEPFLDLHATSSLFGV